MAEEFVVEPENPEFITDYLTSLGYGTTLELITPGSLKVGEPSRLLTPKALERTPRVDNEFLVVTADTRSQQIFGLLSLTPNPSSTIMENDLTSAEVFLKLSAHRPSSKPFAFIADFGNAEIGGRPNIAILFNESRRAALTAAHFFIVTRYGGNNNHLFSIAKMVVGRTTGERIHLLHTNEKDKIAEVLGAQAEA